MAASGHSWLSKSSVDWYLLDRELDSIPSDFRAARFDSLKHVVEILGAVDPKDTVEELKDSKRRLENLIDQVVDTYHTGFNVAIQNYSHILQLFAESRDQVDALRQSFMDARRKLGSQSRVLRQHWSKNIKLDYACRILDKVGQVIDIPAQIDGFQKEKDWPQAVKALIDGCGKLCTEELSRVHALRKVRDDLAARWKMLQSEITMEIQRRVYETELTDIDDISTSAKTRMSHRRTGNLSAGQTPRHMRHVSQGSEKDSSCSARGSSFTLRQQLPEGDITESTASRLSIKDLVDCLAQMGSLGELKTAMAGSIATRTRGAIVKVIKTAEAGKKVHRESRFGMREGQGIAPGSSNLSQPGSISPEVSLAAQELLESVCNHVSKILQNLLYVFGVVCQSDGVGEPTAVQLFRAQIQEQQQQVLSMRLSQSATASPPQGHMEQASLQSLRGREYLDEACLDVWRCAQNEVLQFAADLLNCPLRQIGQGRSDSQNWLARLESDKVARNKDKGGNIEGERKSQMTFSFGLRVAGDSQSDLRGTGLGDEETVAYSQLIKQILKHPGGEYLSPCLYHVIVHFVDNSQRAIKSALEKHEEGMGDQGQALKKKHHQLGQFIENFIMDSFVPQVWVDFRGQVTDALEDVEAFKPQTRTRSLSKSIGPELSPGDSVLKAASVAQKMVKEVSEWVPAIPPFASSLTGVIENILGRFLDAFVVKVNSALGELICGKKASNPEIVSLMAQETDAALMPDPATFYSITGAEVVEIFSSVSPSPPSSLGSAESDFAEAEIIRSILAEKPIRIEQVMARPGNFDKMVEVATLCNSLDFIASSITGLINKYDLPASTNTAEVVSGRLKTRKSRNVSIGLPDTLFGSLTALIDRYKALAGLCIRALRLEMICLAAYHITELTSITHLCEDSDRTEMPPSLSALIRNTARAEEEIAPHLPLHKRKYVLSILPSACTNIFMWILPDLKEINLTGVERMTRMLSVLQPALSSFLSTIVGSSIRVFDHARAYYSLLNMSVEDFLAYAGERPGRFLYSEWKVLLEVHVPGRWVAGEHIQRLDKLIEQRKMVGAFTSSRKVKVASRHTGKG